MSSRTTILGLNAWHGDAAACVLVDGEVAAAAEEERFGRIKHQAGFPTLAIRACLSHAGLRPDQVDHVAVNRRPRANLLRKAAFAFARRPELGAVRDRLANAARVRGLRGALAEAFGEPPRARLHAVEHHHAHLASAFLCSPFESAAAVSVDGFGDFVSTLWADGEGTELRAGDAVHFPHSLGMYYLALTQFLGFPRYGDEYKVMGLAALGQPRFVTELRRVLRTRDEGRFELDLGCFRHHAEGVPMQWEGGAPVIGQAFTGRLAELLGPCRRPEEPLTPRHADLAASVQAVYEEAFFHLLDHVWRRTRRRALCLAGGCAMNSVANGRIRERSEFRELYVPPAPGDAGGAMGAALWVWCRTLGRPRPAPLLRADLGPAVSDDDCAAVLAARSGELAEQRCGVRRVADEAELCALVAGHLVAGRIVGWFHGRMEWGPRALGQRSILADPRRSDVKDQLNLRVKRREGFRPFAPAVLREAVGEWFEVDADVPFMSEVFTIREEQRRRIPAVVHADGTGRLQTVSRDASPRFHRLISSFRDLTGVPIVLDTSFNENEPIVCLPHEALDCFLRSGLDVLVLENHLVSRM